MSINRNHAYLIILTTVAAVLRFLELDLRVFHHDEAAVGYFAYRLFSEGVYSYDPSFHGPFLYYATAFLYGVLGDSVFSSRVLPAITGVLIIPLIFCLRRYIGRSGVFIAGFLFAVSPSFVYYSRFFRNDIIVVFFILATFICALKYLDSGKMVFAAAAGSLLALSAASKENTYIYITIFISYFIFVSMLEFLTRKPISLINLLKHHFTGISVGAACFFMVYAIFYTDFFTNPSGILAYKSAISHWHQMHQVERIAGPVYFYIPLLLLYELPIVIFAISGTIYYVLLHRLDKFNLFLIYWSVASLLAYSYLGEKVPWLILHILLPMTLLAASFLNEIIASLHNRNIKIKRVFEAVFAISLLLFVFSSFQLNYDHFTDTAEPLIQAAQPPQEFQQLIDTIDVVALQYDGYDTNIQATDKSIETQFLWYLRHYKKVHWNVSLNSTLDSPIIVVHDVDSTRVENKLDRSYLRLDSAKMGWYWFKTSDITPGYILFRNMNRPPEEYGVVLFYRDKNTTPSKSGYQVGTD
ncbi:MAG: TIGR03663 family protein [Methanosarcinales archaeon]|uniref:TIGR03663 family protein n=1 Tax=Candidatus Ethanoperedens thermophilum TaxID=2766897 RepID=A0A848D8V8_9EURY|nr:TIGR03663 family protein [Candidatus Ethanoperedens thermophilum]